MSALRNFLFGRRPMTGNEIQTLLRATLTTNSKVRAAVRLVLEQEALMRQMGAIRSRLSGGTSTGGNIFGNYGEIWAQCQLGIQLFGPCTSEHDGVWRAILLEIKVMFDRESVNVRGIPENLLAFVMDEQAYLHAVYFDRFALVQTHGSASSTDSKLVIARAALEQHQSSTGRRRTKRANRPMELHPVVVEAQAIMMRFLANMNRLRKISSRHNWHNPVGCLGEMMAEAIGMVKAPTGQKGVDGEFLDYLLQVKTVLRSTSINLRKDTWKADLLLILQLDPRTLIPTVLYFGQPELVMVRAFREPDRVVNGKESVGRDNKFTISRAQLKVLNFLLLAHASRKSAFRQQRMIFHAHWIALVEARSSAVIDLVVDRFFEQVRSILSPREWECQRTVWENQVF